MIKNEFLLKRLFNNLLTNIEKCNYNLYFLDYNKKDFSSQLHQIYNNIKEDYKTNNIPKDITLFYLHKNLSEFEAKYISSYGKSYFIDYFKNETFDWKVVKCSTIYGFSILSPLNKTFGQVTVEYKEKLANDNVLTRYMVFQRNLVENLSFHSWKVFIVDYKDISEYKF